MEMMDIPVYLATKVSLPEIVFDKKCKLIDAQEEIKLEAKREAATLLVSHNQEDFDAEIILIDSQLVGKEALVSNISMVVVSSPTDSVYESDDKLAAIVRNLHIRLDQQDAKNSQQDAKNSQLDTKNSQLDAKNSQLEAYIAQLQGGINQLQGINYHQNVLIYQLSEDRNQLSAWISQQNGRISQQDANIYQLSEDKTQLSAMISQQNERISQQDETISQQGTRINALQLEACYQQLLLVLQDLNAFFRIEDIYRNNKPRIAAKIRKINKIRNRSCHVVSVAPHSNPYTVADYQPVNDNCDSKAEICHKFSILHRFLSSDAITDDLIDKVGREAFLAIKSHFEAAISGPNALDPAKNLAEEDVIDLNIDLANSLSMFTEFTV